MRPVAAIAMRPGRPQHGAKALHRSFLSETFKNLLIFHCLVVLDLNLTCLYLHIASMEPRRTAPPTPVRTGKGHFKLAS